MTAAWLTIVRDVAQRITSGETPVGTKIPSTQQLATRHGVSLNTVRKAVDHLSEAGVVDSQQGVGVFVKRAPREEDLAPRPSMEERLAALEAWRVEVESRSQSRE